MTDSVLGGGVTVHVDARARGAAAVVRAVRPDPAADDGFVGRDAERAKLLALLTPAHPTAAAADLGWRAGPAAHRTGAGDVGVVVVSAVAGAPGVGKTALAQATARAAVGKGWFPGGAVTVDLHGYDPDPAQVVWPAQLYPGLLRALGVEGEQVPPDESEQATVYHQALDQLAEAGRPVLLVLDNVGDPDQVAPLLPHGTSAHRVLITSRDSMARLRGARLLDLHVLSPDAAVYLLKAGLRRRNPTDRRVTDDPDAAARLVELCGHLPLAVQIVAALLADEPDRPLPAMVAELTDERHRLHALDYDGRWAVRAAIDLSHRRLDPPTAELLALLAAVPGPDVGLAVAAAVADRDHHVTRSALRALCRAHLLDQQPAPPGQEHGQSGLGPRWRMHDLIRLYAAEHLTPDQHTAGFTRVLTHYRHTAHLAEQRFTALPADQDRVPAGFTTPHEATAWVVQERAGLVAATVHAADAHPQDTVGLAADLAPMLQRAWLLADWVTIASAAVRAADVFDQRSAAGAWSNLGLALREVRRFDEAITAHQRAGDICREVGDRHGEGTAWNDLGLALRQVRRFDEAITAHQRAGDICREVGDRHSKAKAWNNLGLALRQVRRFDEAITAHQRDLDICRELGDRHSEGTAWNNLGSALQDVRRFDEAITAHQRAGDIFREVGDRHGEGTAWNNLGLALRQVRRFDEAITAHQRAGDIHREVGDRHGEGTAWNNLGSALREVRRFDEAITAYAQDISICAELGDRYGQAQTLVNLGKLHFELNDLDLNRGAWVDAADLYTAVGADDAAAQVRQWLANLGRSGDGSDVGELVT